MKVYVYYLIDKTSLSKLNSYGVLDRFCNEYEKGKPYLYAYTDSKELSEIFELMRNPNAFLKKVIKMEKKEFSEFSRVYSTACKIGMHELRYKVNKTVTLPITLGEYWHTVDSRRETICEILEKLPKINIDIFKIDTREIIQNINYDIEVLYSDDIFRIPSVTQKFINKYGWKNELGLYNLLYNSIINLERLLAEVVINNG